jgi:hypothetical protein
MKVRCDAILKFTSRIGGMRPFWIGWNPAIYQAPWCLVTIRYTILRLAWSANHWTIHILTLTYQDTEIGLGIIFRCDLTSQLLGASPKLSSIHLIKDNSRATVFLPLPTFQWHRGQPYSSNSLVNYWAPHLHQISMDLYDTTVWGSTCLRLARHDHASSFRWTLSLLNFFSFLNLYWIFAARLIDRIQNTECNRNVEERNS